jgi:hypothetical protein
MKTKILRMMAITTMTAITTTRTTSNTTSPAAIKAAPNAKKVTTKTAN